MGFPDIDFLIIGAAKSATTWLQTMLQADPAVAMPDPELHYFSRCFDKGDSWYLSQFPARPQAIIGEKSNSYLSDPAAPARIHKVLGHARLIAQLRNPIERAYSDYCMLYRRGEVDGQIEKHLDPREAANGRFLQDGLYAPQLERFTTLYPSEQFLVLAFESVRAKPAEHLGRVRGFLGLTEPFHPDAVSGTGKVKDKETAVIGPQLRRMLKPIKPLVKPFRGNKAFDMLRNQIARPLQYPPLTHDLRARLVDFYARDMERVVAIGGSDFDGWLRSLCETASPEAAE
ncbi:MAG: sulfotransferase [Alphaproteobacteria bacterium]|nr:sulfotransferase [Alphaproteobacteria bacterium]